jgi:hypothetical protein
MSTAEKRTPHRKPIFAKPLIDNYLREIGEIGLDKRSRVHPLPVGNCLFNARSFPVAKSAALFRETAPREPLRPGAPVRRRA